MSDTYQPPPAAPLPRIGRVTLLELFICLRAGWRDFARAPLFGLAFSAVYVAGGLALVALSAGALGWTLAVSLGFPLVAPFAAVGLYEVSRRLEAGRPLDWRLILGVVLAERHRQLPWMGAVVAIYFLFWTFLAHMIFALVLGMSPLKSATLSPDILLSSDGLTLVAVELVVGGTLAFLLFAMTVVSLPLLLEREVDFVSAMLLSIETVRENPVVLTTWAAIIAILLVLAMLPAFLGLFVVLPVLGHATWHLYRRALYDPV